MVQREAGKKKGKLYLSQVTHVLKSLYLKSWKPKPVHLSDQSFSPGLPPTKTKKDETEWTTLKDWIAIELTVERPKIFFYL